MVPTSVTGFVVSLALLPRLLRALGPRRTMVIGLVVLAAGHLWLGHAPAHAGYLVAVLPGLLLVAVGVALSFMPTTMVIASAAPDAHAGLASGLAGSTSQVGAALGTATFTAIGLAAGGAGASTLTPSGFTAAFTAAAVVALATALLGLTITRRPARLYSADMFMTVGAWARALRELSGVSECCSGRSDPATRLAHRFATSRPPLRLRG